MKQLSSTSMSSRGQVVIPEQIRKALNLHAGDQFIVFCEKDVVILKVITPPNMSEFDDLIKKARKSARQVGISKTNVKSAIVFQRLLKKGQKVAKKRD
jgi:AbrB family looped-hinge helix DNA binding protein